MQTSRAAELAAVVQAFDDACNANDVERALALFADNAVVTQLQPPAPDMSVYHGRREIRGWLAPLLQQCQVAARNHRVDGARITWEATVSADLLRRMGLTSVEDTAEAAVRDGTFVSFTFTVRPGSSSISPAAS